MSPVADDGGFYDRKILAVAAKIGVALSEGWGSTWTAECAGERIEFEGTKAEAAWELLVSLYAQHMADDRGEHIEDLAEDEDFVPDLLAWIEDNVAPVGY